MCECSLAPSVAPSKSSTFWTDWMIRARRGRVWLTTNGSFLVSSPSSGQCLFCLGRRSTKRVGAGALSPILKGGRSTYAWLKRNASLVIPRYEIYHISELRYRECCHDQNEWQNNITRGSGEKGKLVGLQKELKHRTTRQTRQISVCSRFVSTRTQSGD